MSKENNRSFLISEQDSHGDTLSSFILFCHTTNKDAPCSLLRFVLQGQRCGLCRFSVVRELKRISLLLFLHSQARDEQHGREKRPSLLLFFAFSRPCASIRCTHLSLGNQWRDEGTRVLFDEYPFLSSNK